MASAYVLCNIGFGVHVCEKDGSNLIVLLHKGESGCVDIHGHASGHEECCHLERSDCTEHDNCVEYDDGCCRTDIHYLDIDGSEVGKQVSSGSLFELSCVVYAHFSDRAALTNRANVGMEFLFIDDPPFREHLKIYPYISQWRL